MLRISPLYLHEGGSLSWRSPYCPASFFYLSRNGRLNRSYRHCISLALVKRVDIVISIVITIGHTGLVLLGIKNKILWCCPSQISRGQSFNGVSNKSTHHLYSEENFPKITPTEPEKVAKQVEAYYRVGHTLSHFC